MKLEAAATKGKDVLKLKPLIEAGVLNTSFLVHEIFKHRSAYSAGDLAFSTQLYLAQGLAQLAIDQAKRLSVDSIGFSGGVACNEHITQTIRNVVEKNGLKFLVHQLVPPGDGGISLGQAVVAAWQIKN
jgi:hydrogenase maturation protein HypF